MSDQADPRQVSNQSMYVVWVLLFVAMMWILQLMIPVGLYVAFYGMPKLENLLETENADYSHSTLWKGRFWYTVIEHSMDSMPSKSKLISVHPITGEVNESTIQIPFPILGLLADSDRLWAISINSVTKIEGDQVSEYRPMRVITLPCQVFLYENQVAVLESNHSSTPTLLVLENHEWKDLGIVSVPIGATPMEGSNRLERIESEPGSAASGGQTEIRVLTQGSEAHVFFHGPDFVAYRREIEFAPASALAPANQFGVPELGNVEGWEVVVTASDTEWFDDFDVGFIDGEPIVLTRMSDLNDSNLNRAYQKNDGIWTATKSSTGSSNFSDLTAVTDGEKTYLAEELFTGTVRFEEVTKSQIKPTGAVLKAKDPPIQKLLETWGFLSQWVFWPTLLILAIGVSMLMSAYRSSRYQFGLTDVELASILRRGIARVIDYFVYFGPVYLLFRLNGFSSPEQVTFDIENLFEGGDEAEFIRFILTIFSALLLGLGLLFVHSLFQGFWGISLGKWLCGIRTVRTTLRPCGFFRALLRELVIMVDTIFMMTWLPVTLLIAFTSCRQRIGDMVADTIIIRRPKLVATDENAIRRATED